jgi:DNA polymerase-3 subunit epsilon
LRREEVAAEMDPRVSNGADGRHFLGRLVSALTSLARASWENGVVTDHERRDLNDVALPLGLPMTAVKQALETSSTSAGGCDMPIGSLRLSPGDRICFTGEMSMPRDELQALALALAAGLEVTSTVSKKTTMLVRADADSLSGKAKKARGPLVRR